MDISAWGAIGEVIGAAAVVVSLIYLANQVKYAARAAQVQAHQGVTQSGLQLNEMIVAHPDAWARGHAAPSSLSPEDRITFHYILTSHLFQLVDLWHATANQSFDEAIFQRWLVAVASMLKTEGGAEFWDGARTLFIPELVSAIDEARRQVPPWTELHPGHIRPAGAPKR